jgi:hypothetical protein
MPTVIGFVTEISKGRVCPFVEAFMDGTVISMPTHVKRFNTAARASNSTICDQNRLPNALAKELEAPHVGLDEAASVISAPLFPYCSSQLARRSRNLIACLDIKTIRLPVLSLFTGRDNGMRLA